MKSQHSHPEPKLITPGEIARALSEPIHRVTHILATRSHIRPKARAGRLRLYSVSSIEQVRTEIERIDTYRDRTEGGAS